MNSDTDLNSVQETIMKIVGDHLGVPKATLTPEMYIMDDLGGDSLDRIELIMTVEEMFGTKLDEEEIRRIQCISDIIVAIENTLSKSSDKSS